MEEGKLKEIEAKLRELIALQDKSEEEKNRPAWTAPPGTKVIRRRKNWPDKHIV
jgi:hypothetical protein